MRTSADTTLTLMSLSTETMSTSRPGLSRVAMSSTLHEPLGASRTSMVVGTTTRRRGPRGDVLSRWGREAADWPAARFSAASCGGERAGRWE